MWKWITAGVVAIVALYGVSVANGLVVKDEAVSKSYAQVQNVMKRQADLIPNLVETVKGYAKFEQDTFTNVAEARSKAGGVIKLDASSIANDPQMQQKLQEAQNSLSQTIGRMLMLQEKYPELKADKGFQDLRTELSGSINRITQERRLNQEAVNEYNMKVRQFPAVVIANVLGYQKKPYFEAPESAQDAPKVKF